jgi:Yip1 domain
MNIVERVKNILIKPKDEWPVIEREPGNAQYLFTNYVAILALIPAIAGFIGMTMVGFSIPPAGKVYIAFGTALLSAIFAYIITFVIAYVVALIIDALAPTFGGQKNFENALKVSVYSYTPFWLAGIFALIPSLAFLGILGLYGFYLLYVGLPPLMKSPPERSLLYTVTVIVCALVIAIVLGLIQAAILR